MKCLVILLVLTSFYAHGSPKELLKCLGAEEKEFHAKKEIGPLYDLNQRMLAEMVQIPNANIAPAEISEICAKSSSPSSKLLELTLAKGKNIFVIPENIPGMQKQMTEGMIEDYIEISKELLLNYIGQIQALSPTPDCLNDAIKGLKEFYIDVKHLQEDVDVEKLFEKHDRKIFSELRTYPTAYKRCREELLKKKPKSGSTPSAKNL